MELTIKVANGGTGGGGGNDGYWCSGYNGGTGDGTGNKWE